MSRLPDPRPVPVIPDDFRFAAPLRALADPAAGGDRSRVRETLVGALRKRMVAGDDATVRSVLDQAAPGSAALAVRAALDDAIQRAGDDEAVPLLARIFLMPVLFVAGGKAPATVPGVIPDMEAVTGLMRRAGALGPVENFGLANALGSIEAAEAVMPSRLFALAREIGAADGAALLPPADLDIATADEHVQLRYLAGASVTAADMPTFVETAGQVGRWGMAVSQAIAERLAEPGLSLLPLPRAPQPWFRALAEGRFAREELAFNLFAAAAIRRIRTETGDPEAEISARDDGSVRVDLVSPFNPMLRHAHRWALSAADDIVRVEQSIRDLLQDCRVEKVTVHADVLPAQTLPTPGASGLLPH